tara:strand:+ start:1542 stop:1886 length:345 start_codon:yes stop_codon:yes gene_type:complete
MTSPFKIKLNINVKDKNLSKQLQDYVDNEIYNFSYYVDNGEVFDLRYKKFLNSEMKKGQEVDQDLLERFIKDCENRYDMDVNGTDEEPYKTFGKRFGTIVRNLNKVCFENKEIN